MAESSIDHRSEEVSVAGRIGFAGALTTGVVLAVHPLGSTEIYAGGEPFLDHVGPFSVVIHLVATVALLAIPATIAVWARNLGTTESRFVGRIATTTAVIAVGLGAFHMIAVDTVVFEMFRGTYEAASGTEAAVIALDVLVRLHAASLVAWSTTLVIALPALLAWSSVRDGRMPSLTTGLVGVAPILGTAAMVITLVEAQWTTLSEQILFRTAVTLLLVWLLLTTWRMWKDGSVVAVPGSNPHPG